MEIWRKNLLENPPRRFRKHLPEWREIVSELIEDPTKKTKGSWGFGSKHTEESKELIRKNGTGIKKRPLTEAEKEVLRNRVFTREWKENISKGLCGKKKKSWKMPKRSPEHCAKLAEIKRAYWAARRTAQV